MTSVDEDDDAAIWHEPLCLGCDSADRSWVVSRARAREEWRVAEAGRLAHLLELGRPLCGATDPGPWRAVAGAVRCAACVDLSEVLARHG